MKNYIANVRAHGSLRLKHPDNKLAKFIRIRRVGSFWPLQLPIGNGKLQTSSRFTKSILKW
jgi:hypothetical protein